MNLDGLSATQLTEVPATIPLEVARLVCVRYSSGPEGKPRPPKSHSAAQAGEYVRIDAKPEHQADTHQIDRWLRAQFQGRRLEWIHHAIDLLPNRRHQKHDRSSPGA